MLALSTWGVDLWRRSADKQGPEEFGNVLSRRDWMAEKMERTGKSTQASDSQFKRPSPSNVVVGLQPEDRGHRRITMGVLNAPLMQPGFSHFLSSTCGPECG